MARNIDDIVENLRLYGGKLDALADALDLTPDNAEWLRRQRLAESADDRHARAVVDSRLMKDQGFHKNLRMATIAERHYDGRQHGAAANVVMGDVSSKTKATADALERWLREEPERLAKYLATLPEIFSV